jgi:hypothetical protein
VERDEFGRVSLYTNMTHVHLYMRKQDTDVNSAQMARSENSYHSRACSRLQPACADCRPWWCICEAYPARDRMSCTDQRSRFRLPRGVNEP